MREGGPKAGAPLSRAPDSVVPRPAWTVAALAIAALAIRLPSLRGLPVFGDEAIFLRLARLLRADPARDLWNSLDVAMAPMHTWLLALAVPPSADPVSAGRLVSVVAGVLGVVVIFVAVRRLEASLAWGSGPPSASTAALFAAVFAAVSPFFVFADRLARVESLFGLEAVLVGVASAALAASAARGGRGLLVRGIALGALMGATMLTRQAVSYPLWALPVLALLVRSASSGDGGAARRGWWALALAAAVAAILWAPMLAVERTGAPELATRIFHLPATHPAMSAAARAGVAGRNLLLAAAAFWTYLTPPVVLATAVGVPAMLASRRSRLLLFLLGWHALLLLPAALFAASYFPRYALPAAIPLVIIAGFGAAFVWSWIGKRASSAARSVLRAGLVLLLAGAPLSDVGRGERDWRRWRLLPVDREQYVTGWAAGFATEAAARFLAAEGRRESVVVLTPDFAGNPTDSLWLLLPGTAGVRLFYAVDDLRQPLLREEPGRPGSYRLAGDLRDGAPARAVPLGPRDRVCVVSQEPLLTSSGWVPAAMALAPLNPGISEVARFENPASPQEKAAGVTIFRVPSSHSADSRRASAPRQD